MILYGVVRKNRFLLTSTLRRLIHYLSARACSSSSIHLVIFTSVVFHYCVRTLPYSEHFQLMNVVHLSPATPTEDLRALEEVDEFASTDMGWGGSDRWTYRVLAPEEVTPELLRQSQHAIYRHSQSRIDSVTFQPCQSYESRSQDRHTVQSWDMPGGSWTFSAVLDGMYGCKTFMSNS